MVKQKEKRTRLPEIATRELTINVHKQLITRSRKQRAPRALQAIRKIAQTEMKTTDVRIDVELNKYLWHRGIKNVPFKVRVRFSRRRNEEEDAKEKLYTLVSYVPVASFKKLESKTVEETE